jgi:hypothetical protein
MRRKGFRDRLLVLNEQDAWFHRSDGNGQPWQPILSVLRRRARLDYKCRARRVGIGLARAWSLPPICSGGCDVGVFDHPARATP